MPGRVAHALQRRRASIEVRSAHRDALFALTLAGCATYRHRLDEESRPPDRSAAVDAPAVRAVGDARQGGVNLGEFRGRMRKLRDVHAALCFGRGIVVRIVSTPRQAGFVMALLPVPVQTCLQCRGDLGTHGAQFMTIPLDASWDLLAFSASEGRQTDDGLSAFD